MTTSYVAEGILLASLALLVGFANGAIWEATVPKRVKSTWTISTIVTLGMLIFFWMMRLA